MKNEIGGHYSEKGGHKARGDAERVKTQFARQFPGVAFIKPENQVARRSMRRITKSGR